MNKILSSISLIALLISFAGTAFADFRLRQQVTMSAGGGEFTQERAVWVKDARERTESRFITDDERVSQMMPQIAEVRQCDLRQTLKINDRSKKYFIEPFYETNDKPLPPVQPSTKTEVRKGGTVTWEYTITDTGERRQMFGLTARRLIIKQLAETSKDSCQGESRVSMEEDGWYVYLMPETARCMIDLPRGEGRGPTEKCRDKLTLKGAFRYPGMMLEGTTKMTDLLKNDTMTSSVKTLELSKATLEMSLFEIPAGYAEVNSEQSLMSIPAGNMMTGGIFNSSGAKTSDKKAVAVDFFAGSLSKINQNEMRQYLARKVSTSRTEGVVVISQNDITSGAYAYVVGVEIKSAKESGASKIGGLFGKVTGNTEVARLGKSEAEIVVTLYDKDGKTVLATGTAKEKTDGTADDAVRAAIDKAILPILAQMK